MFFVPGNLYMMSTNNQNFDSDGAEGFPNRNKVFLCTKPMFASYNLDTFLDEPQKHIGNRKSALIDIVSGSYWTSVTDQDIDYYVNVTKDLMGEDNESED